MLLCFDINVSMCFSPKHMRVKEKKNKNKTILLGIWYMYVDNNIVNLTKSEKGIQSELIERLCEYFGKC